MPATDLLGQADALYRRGEYATALKLYEEARSARKSALFQAFIDLNVAQCLRRIGHLRQALVTAEHGLARLDGLPPTPTLGQLLVTNANCVADLARHDEALTILNRAKRLFSDLGDSHALGQVSIALARSLAELGRDDEAKSILTDLLQTSVPMLIESQALNNLATILQNSDPAVAETLLLRDLRLQDELGDDYGKAVTITNLAQVAIIRGHRERAAELIKDAYKAANQANTVELLVIISRIEQRLAQPQ